MEPVLGGRDDHVADNAARLAKLAAMEPVLGGRDDAGVDCPGARLPVSPQWSPSLADGTTAIAGSCRCRLLAPQWSPSLADGTTCRESGRPWPVSAPQWSPSLADGTTRGAPRGPVLDRVAAMEPVLGGRDDLPPGFRTLNSLPGRNGARPWRTGRPVRQSPRDDAPTSPQWSPSLADGTTR